jgi:hypothetical protein
MTLSSSFVFFFFCVVAVLVSSSRPAQAFTLFVEPLSDACVYEPASKNDKIVTNFEVVLGGFLDVDIVVKEINSDRVIYRDDRQKEGEFIFFAPMDGVYEFCFGNSMSTVSGKTVSFDIMVGSTLTDAATKSHVDPLHKEVLQLSENIGGMLDTTRFMKIRMRVSKRTSRSTNRRALWWPIMENFVLIMSGVAQIMYIRSVFERKGGRR